MNSKGIMRRARRRILLFVSTMLVVSVGFAQTPAASADEDLDVTMRVIVDPDAKVPDEIVRRIALPKPQQPAGGTPPPSDKKPDKPADPGAKGKERAPEPHSQGREFGQETAEQARQRAEEARHNKDKDKPPKPPKPPAPPRGPG